MASLHADTNGSTALGHTVRLLLPEQVQLIDSDKRNRILARLRHSSQRGRTASQSAPIQLRTYTRSQMSPPSDLSFPRNWPSGARTHCLVR
jgi:hypothetical protein